MHILLCDALYSGGTLYRDHGVVFDKTILEVRPGDELRERFGGRCTELGEGSVIFPGLINAHVHLEFSANRSTLDYGGFMPWLSSVIAHRDELISECDDACIARAVQTMLANGITAFGAISSYGFDLDACAKAPQKVVYFNELIGSDPAMADALYTDFQERLFASQEHSREGFYPAVAIHSPYSVHPVLIRKALDYARHHRLRVSTHFLESRAEREWLDRSEGEFKPFFENFLRQSRAANSAEGFLALFEGVNALLTHAVWTDEAELSRIADGGHTIVHCPVSNRLLGNGALDLERLDAHAVRWVCGTDGLSSNYTLDLFEEMKIALFLHHSRDLAAFARRLWQSVTEEAAAALGLNCGTIAPGRDADLVVGRVDYPINDQLPLQMLLHRPTIEAVYVGGHNVKGS